MLSSAAAGAAGLVAASHALVFGLSLPLLDAGGGVRPSWGAWSHVGCFYLAQFVLASVAPGVVVRANGLDYKCNAYATLWLTVLLASAASALGLLDLAAVRAMYPALLACSMIIGNGVALVVGVRPRWFDAARPPSSGGGVLETFVAGRCLHPRCGAVDVKMLCETRLSWTLLGFVSVGCLMEVARNPHRGDGALPASGVVALAHLLYANACAKGEHYIPFTWDITTERFGWLLAFWNLCGVPFVYAHPALLIAARAPAMTARPAGWYVGLVCALLVAYWQWDIANADKNEFRARERGTVPRRALFPTFRPLRRTPRCLRLESGRTFLLEGMWGRARKFHYTMDAAMALVIALAANEAGPTAWAHFGFMVLMLVHRALRDERHCRQKYGGEWEAYLRAVPWRFVPGVW